MRQQGVKAGVGVGAEDVSVRHGVLSVSVVLFEPDVPVLRETLSALALAAMTAGLTPLPLVLVDNSDALTPELYGLASTFTGVFDLVVRHGQGNVGYGAGHNLALGVTRREFHLILNPDVVMEEGALSVALGFMRAQPECALLAPHATWPDGRIQRLCKRYPDVLSLLLRGFAPAVVRKVFRVRLAHYEMQEVDDDEVVWDPPIVSGCFMFWRRSCLDEIGGFDPAYFLYFEDFDLSLRAAGVGRLARVRSVRIVHQGGRAASKGLRHICLFARSGLRFFSAHGWRWW